MSEAGKRKLTEYGIAPPTGRAPAGPIRVKLSVACPRCGSLDTREVSRFGSTSCKSHWECRARPRTLRPLQGPLMTMTDATPSSPAGASTPGPCARRASCPARFHTLRVADVRPLTPTAIEVTFTVPDELADSFDYAAGQYVALRARVDGDDLRRSYSLCRPPARGTISVGIKRDPDGRFSTWAHEACARG